MRQSFYGFRIRVHARRTRDMPGLRVLNIDPPIFTVDDFLSASECDELTAAGAAVYDGAIGAPKKISARRERWR